MAPKSNKNDKCHDCGKDVITNEKALSCPICENWYHIKRQKVPILDYDFLLKSDDSIQWICKGCKGASRKICKMLTLMHQRQEKLEKEVSTLKTSFVDCNEKIASVDKNISELIDNLPKIVSEQVSQIIDDKSEEVKRQSNVIFFGVPENE